MLLSSMPYAVHSSPSTSSRPLKIRRWKDTGMP